MKRRARQTVRMLTLGVPVLGIAWACGFDGSLREYLTIQFWQPFPKRVAEFERADVERTSVPFAGMAPASMAGDDAGQSGFAEANTLSRLRAAYQRISQPIEGELDRTGFDALLDQARAEDGRTRREQEEIDLIDAKIDIRAGNRSRREPLEAARVKLDALLASAATPEYLSEARGWLGRVHYLLGHQAEAGKLYLDELNRDGSNLSRETLLNSLSMNYYDGGYDGATRGLDQLMEELDEYFDTPEHAAFALEMVTNRGAAQAGINEDYRRVMDLVTANQALLEQNTGSQELALLSMRVALRMGDVERAVEVAEMVPADAAARQQPDFLWMLGSAYFLSGRYEDAEAPLLALFASAQASDMQHAAAAYALCGVYQKLGDPVQQIRYALWLQAEGRQADVSRVIGDTPVYWAPSGWDLNLLLEGEAPLDALEMFVARYPNAREMRLVKYAIAVRYAREDRYEDAARVYEEIGQPRRGPRMRELAGLWREVSRGDLMDAQRLEAQYAFAEFLEENPNRIYFNDSLWYGLQRYALQSEDDVRLTAAERERFTGMERELRDQQEEHWRAYLILREIVNEAGETELGRRAARLAIQCLRRIRTDRFGREEEIRDGDIELSLWLGSQ